MYLSHLPDIAYSNAVMTMGYFCDDSLIADNTQEPAGTLLSLGQALGNSYFIPFGKEIRIKRALS